MRYYVVISDENGNWRAAPVGRAAAGDQREAVEKFAAKYDLEEGQSYVVFHADESPTKFERYSDARLAKVDWDYWTFDENLEQHGEGEGPPITV